MAFGTVWQASGTDCNSPGRNVVTSEPKPRFAEPLLPPVRKYTATAITTRPRRRPDEEPGGSCAGPCACRRVIETAPMPARGERLHGIGLGPVRYVLLGLSAPASAGSIPAGSACIACWPGRGLAPVLSSRPRLAGPPWPARRRNHRGRPGPEPGVPCRIPRAVRQVAADRLPRALARLLILTRAVALLPLPVTLSRGRPESSPPWAGSAPGRGTRAASCSVASYPDHLRRVVVVTCPAATGPTGE